MRPCSNLCTDISFIVTRLSEGPDIRGKWFNAKYKAYKETVYDVGFGTDGSHIKKIFLNEI